VSTPDYIGVLLALSAVTIASALGWTAAALAWLLVRGLALAPVTRAALLAQVRLLPLIAVAVIASAQIVSFVRFEGELTSESAGPLLIVAALPGVALILDALVVAWRSSRLTGNVVGGWRHSAVPLAVAGWRYRAWQIDREFPVVAVVGVWRPELFVSARVAANCTPAELVAIAAHEAAHVRAGDNLMRAMFTLTPGVGFLSSLARAIERDWSAAAERAADDKARQSTSGLDLASALTRVARMAIDAPQPVFGSTLVGELPLESRVRALLEPPTPAPRFPVAWVSAAGYVATAGFLQRPQVLMGLHELFGLLLRR
jgi:hypothetical protein